MFDQGSESAAQLAMATSVMDPVFQSAFNVVKGSVPARTDVPNDAFDDCGKKGMADFAEANAGGGLYGSMAHGHANPAAVKNAIYDVVTAHFNGEFDAVTIAFGLRNVTDKNAALREMYRVLKPGGKAMILEFSKVQPEPLKAVYDAWSFGALPILGKLIANDEDSYRYLAESIRMHPDQEALMAMMQEAGFERNRYHNLLGGVVALHVGYRI